MCFIDLIAHYLLSLGTTAGSDNVVDKTRLSFDQSSLCFNGLALRHKRTYFGSITAVNGGLVVRSVTVSTNGGRRLGC